MRISSSLYVALITSLPLTLGVSEGRAEWQVGVQEQPTNGRPWVQAVTSLGDVSASVACADWMFPQFQFSGYDGSGLERIDNAISQIRLEIVSGDGEVLYNGTSSFYYFAPDETWLSQQGEAPPFLSAWARGTQLRIWGANGEPVAELDLIGTSRAYAAMQRICKQ